MKFTKIRLTKSDSGSINVDFPLEGVGPLTPYVLKAADGLGPPEVDVSIVPTLLMGGVYQGRRPQLRQVVLRVGLQPEWNVGQTPEELRSAMYSLLTPKYPNTLLYLKIMNGETVVGQVECHISKLEVAAFSKDPEVQITLNCKSAYFKAPTPVTTQPAMVTNGSETYFTLQNPGTAETPFELRFKFTQATTGPVRLSYASAASWYIEVDKPFAIDDQLVINTAPGSRVIYKKPVATGALTSIFETLNPNSTWLQLIGGDNDMRINQPNVAWPSDGVKIYPNYWGI